VIEYLLLMSLINSRMIF